MQNESPEISTKTLRKSEVHGSGHPLDKPTWTRENAGPQVGQRVTVPSRMQDALHQHNKLFHIKLHYYIKIF